MKISVVTPVLNEIRFIKGWYENVRKFSDEIICVDMGSTDGTYEFLQSQADRKLRVYRWPEFYQPHHWPEHEIRNWTLRNASGDWIAVLDADDLIGDDFIETLNDLATAKWMIGRYIYLQFWNGYQYLRKRQIWPPIRLSRGLTSLPVVGHWRIGLLRNYLGWYPNKVAKLCKRDNRIRYTETGDHCILQYKNLNRLSYHLPAITNNFEVGVFHSHFVFFGKEGGNRNHDRNRKVNLVEYHGELPKEIKYYQNPT